MPRSFLTSAQIEELQNFPEAIDYNSLVTYFTLTKSDVDVVPIKSSKNNRLAFAIQLCALRYMGFFPKNIPGAPSGVVTFLSTQLGLSQPPDLEKYGLRAQTQSDHLKLIEKYLGFSPADTVYRNELQKWTTKRSLEHDKPLLLLRLISEKMKQDKRTRLALWELEDVVSNARETARLEVYESLKPFLNEETMRSLDQLLVSEDQETQLNWFSKKATTHSPESILAIIKRIKLIRSLGTQSWDISHLNRNRIKYLTQLGKKSTNQALQRSRPERRYPILIVTLSELLQECTDECIDVFDLCLSSILRRSRNSYEDTRKKQDKLINNNNVALQKIAELVISPDIPDEELRAMILNTIPEQALQEIIKDPHGLIRPLDGNHLDYVIKRFSYIRQFSPAFLARLEFQCQPIKKSLLEAIDILRSMNSSKLRKLPDSTPTDFMHSSWNSRMGKPGDNKSRHYYELAVLWELRNSIRSGEVWVEGSRKYQAIESYLIPRTEWPTIKKEAEELLKLPVKSNDRINERSKDLTKSYSILNRGLPSDDSVIIKDKNLSISPTSAEDEPQSVKALKKLISDRLPRIELTELLIEVDQWTGFSDLLVHAGGSGAMTDGAIYKHASVLAQATNLGLSKMANIADLSYQKLLWCTNWCLQDKTLEKATVKIINFHHNHWLTHFWGDGSFSSSDGQRFAAAVKTNTARPLPKYFAYAKGLNFYSWTSNQFSQYGTDVPASLSEAPYVLDAILDNETELEIERHTTDTGGYTEIMFALFDLVGLRFEPRIKNIGGQTIYYSESVKHFENLANLEVKRLDLDLISKHWDDIVRNAASIKMGWMTASLLISKYQANKRQSEFIRALQEYGRMIKTISILRYASSEEHRREIGTQLNKGETLHYLRQFLLFAREGKIFKRTHEAQKEQAKSLNLVTNAVILWNTVYMGKVIEQLQEEGITISPEDLAHISPARFEHLNPYGKFNFEFNNDLDGDFRPLRSPNTHPETKYS